MYHNLFIVPLLQETAQSVTILEGQSVTLSCIPTPDELRVNWIMNGVIINNTEHTSLSPDHLHHTLTISNPLIEESGEYICYIEDFALLSINKTIRLNVVQGIIIATLD